MEWRMEATNDGEHTDVGECYSHKVNVFGRFEPTEEPACSEYAFP